MAASANGPFDKPQTDDRQLAGSAGNDDIEFGQTLTDILQANCCCPESIGELAPPINRPVGNNDLFRFLRREVGRAQLDHFTRTDKKYALIGDPLKYTLRQANCSGSHRHDIAADGGRGSHILGHRKGMLEQLVQSHTERTRLPGNTHSILHLAKNLRFTEYHRIQPAGNAKSVAHRFTIGMVIEIRLQFVVRQMAVLRKPLSGRQWRICLTVDLSAITGRQNRRFMHPSTTRQIGQRPP